MPVPGANARKGIFIVRTLGPLAAAGTDSRQVADASVAVWTAIEAALSPVIGRRGCAALYARCLHLVAANHAWLAAAYDGATAPDGFASLHVVLARRDSIEAAAVHDALVQTFHDLLADLIGRSLTERLLQSAWDSHAGPHSDQDISP